jgi:drug/metabolite transporter (DMT)-like permease
MTGSRYIQAAEAGLIGLTDIVLGPLWVYLAFGENPGVPTVFGGALILFSVLWYMWGRLRAAQATARRKIPTTV